MTSPSAVRTDLGVAATVGTMRAPHADRSSSARTTPILRQPPKRCAHDSGSGGCARMAGPLRKQWGRP